MSSGRPANSFARALRDSSSCRRPGGVQLKNDVSRMRKMWSGGTDAARRQQSLRAAKGQQDNDIGKNEGKISSRPRAAPLVLVVGGREWVVGLFKEHFRLPRLMESSVEQTHTPREVGSAENEVVRNQHQAMGMGIAFYRKQPGRGPIGAQPTMVTSSIFEMLRTSVLTLTIVGPSVPGGQVVCVCVCVCMRLG